MTDVSMKHNFYIFYYMMIIVFVFCSRSPVGLIQAMMLVYIINGSSYYLVHEVPVNLEISMKKYFVPLEISYVYMCKDYKQAKVYQV